MQFILLSLDAKNFDIYTDAIFAKMQPKKVLHQICFALSTFDYLPACINGRMCSSSPAYKILKCV